MFPGQLIEFIYFQTIMVKKKKKGIFLSSKKKKVPLCMCIYADTLFVRFLMEERKGKGTSDNVFVVGDFIVSVSRLLFSMDKCSSLFMSEH